MQIGTARLLAAVITLFVEIAALSSEGPYNKSSNEIEDMYSDSYDGLTVIGLDDRTITQFQIKNCPLPFSGGRILHAFMTAFERDHRDFNDNSLFELVISNHVNQSNCIIEHNTPIDFRHGIIWKAPFQVINLRRGLIFDVIWKSDGKPQGREIRIVYVRMRLGERYFIPKHQGDIPDFGVVDGEFNKGIIDSVFTITVNQYHRGKGGVGTIRFVKRV